MPPLSGIGDNQHETENGEDMTIVRGGLRMRKVVLGLAALMTLATAPAEGQQNIEALQQQVEQLRQQLARDTTQIAELRRQIEVLTRQMETLSLGEGVAPADSSIFGFAPAASKVYRVGQGVSIGGYGEVLYERFAEETESNAASGRTDAFDALRAILYLGYKFNDRILFNSELEWEHGSTGSGGEASIEFAYVDYLLTPSVGLRGGLLLVPMGITNELHEPPTFLGTTRPLVEQAIIPTTWRANGLGFFGQNGGFAYRAYAITSLDAGLGFSAAGLRGGRQKGARERAEDFSFVGRLDYTGVPGLLVGGSGLIGQTGQGRLVSGAEVDGTTTILEAHADLALGGLDARGLYAIANVDDVAELNALRNLTGAGSIGEQMTGGYIQLGYDVLATLETSHELSPYVRYETLNTQAEVPTGFSASPATDRTAWLIGTMWKPISEVAVKVDYQIHKNQAQTGVNQLNAGLSYLF